MGEDTDVNVNISMLQNWLVDTIKLFASRPEEVVVNVTTDERGVFFVLRLAQVDAGRVIGKAGSTARALRDVIRSLGRSRNMLISLRIDVPTKSESDGTEY